MPEALRLFVVYAATCGICLWLAHRFLGKIRGPIAAVLLLLPLVSTAAAFWQGGFYGALNLSYNTAPLHAHAEELPHYGEYSNGPLADQIFQVVPWRKAVRELVKNGHAPFLNRFSSGGDPLLGGSQPAPFDPKVWIGFLLPLASAVTFACAFVFFQAAFFTFLLARDLGASDLAAVFAGAIFMTCGFLDFYITWSLVSVVVTAPFLLLGLRWIARGDRRGPAVAFIAWALALVGGHPESVLHVTVLGGLFFLTELPKSPDVKRAVLTAVAVGLLVFALAAPVVFPFIEALPQTSDYHVRKNAHPPQSVSWSEVGSGALAALYPHGWGEPWRGGRPELPNRFNAASGAFVGSVALAFALLGAFSGFLKRRFFAITAVLSFALAVGVPGLADVLSKLPLFSLSLNGRLVFVTALSVALLAAFGFDQMRSKPSRGRIATVLGVCGVIAVGGWWRLLAMSELDLWTEGQTRALVWLFAAPLAVAISGLVWRSPRGLGIFWIGLFLLSHRAELPHFYEPFKVEHFYPPVAELDALPQGGEPYRIIARNYDLPPGQSALYELEDMRGPSVMNHRKLAHLRPGWCKPLMAWFCRAHGTESDLLDLFNVRFAISDPSTPAPADWPELARGPRLAIHENPHVLPRAFVPPEIAWAGPDAPVAQRLIKESDFRDRAWLTREQGPFERQSNGRATVKTRADGPDLHVDINAAGPTWVVVSQTFWQGWRATTADGERLPLVPANHAFFAFEAPAGQTSVRLHYRPYGWDVGWAVSATASLIAVLWLWIARRRGPPAAPAEGEAIDSAPTSPGAVEPGRGGDLAQARLGTDEVADGARGEGGDPSPELTVVIPAFNEEERLPSTLEACRRYLVGRRFELLVVDDGSSDRTAEVASGVEDVRLLRLGQNQGKGAALRHGVLASRGRRVLLMDADASIPIDQVARLQAASVPVAIASRVVDGAQADQEQTRLRKFMGRTFNRLLRVLGAVDGIGDTQCGFKLFDGEVARDLFGRSTVRGFAFDVEILWLAGRFGHEIREVGVRWRDHPGSRVRPWLDPPRMLLEIARFRWHHRALPRRQA